jgi:hypothetical protein
VYVLIGISVEMGGLVAVAVTVLVLLPVPVPVLEPVVLLVPVEVDVVSCVLFVEVDVLPPPLLLLDDPEELEDPDEPAPPLLTLLPFSVAKISQLASRKNDSAAVRKVRSRTTKLRSCFMCISLSRAV